MTSELFLPMKRVLLIQFLVLGFFNSQNRNSIVPLKMLTEIGSIKPENNTVTYRTDYFMIENYYSSGLDKAISEYVAKYLDSSFLKYDQYDMLFYRKSDRVNIDNINRYDKNSYFKAIQDDDPVKRYIWYSGKLQIMNH